MCYVWRTWNWRIFSAILAHLRVQWCKTLTEYVIHYSVHLWKCSDLWTFFRYYVATIDEILEDGTCSVIFDKYGSTEVTKVSWIFIGSDVFFFVSMNVQQAVIFLWPCPRNWNWISVMRIFVNYSFFMNWRMRFAGLCHCEGRRRLQYKSFVISICRSDTDQVNFIAGWQ